MQFDCVRHAIPDTVNLIASSSIIILFSWLILLNMQLLIYVNDTNNNQSSALIDDNGHLISFPDRWECSAISTLRVFISIINFLLFLILVFPFLCRALCYLIINWFITHKKLIRLVFCCCCCNHFSDGLYK